MAASQKFVGQPGLGTKLNGETNNLLQEFLQSTISMRQNRGILWDLEGQGWLSAWPWAVGITLRFNSSVCCRTELADSILDFAGQFRGVAR